MIWILVFSNRMDMYENKQIQKYIKNNKIDNIIFLDPNEIFIFINENIIKYFYKEKEIKKPKKVLVKTGCMLNEHTEELLKTLKDVEIINDIDLIKKSSNKFLMANFCSKNKIKHIKTLKLVANIKETKIIIKNFSFPLIIKPKVGSLGTGIYKVNNKKELFNIMASFNLLDNNYQYLIQEYIKEAKEDYRIMVLGGKIKYVLKRKAKKEEFRSNYNLGSDICLIKENEIIKDIVHNIYNKIPLNIMGIDLIKKEDEYILCEINSNPGFKGYDSLGNNFSKIFIEFLIKN